MKERKTALDILNKTITDSAYSNLLMRYSFDNSQNIPFITNLVYGVLENYDSLKYQLKGLYDSTSKYNEIILVMSLYEKFILNKEDYITINEYVDLAKNEYDKSFINAVLRKVNTYKEPDIDYIKCNLPEWIYNLLNKQYSKEDFDLIKKNLSTKKEIYYHINKNKTSFDKLKNLDINVIDEYFFTSNNNLTTSELFSEGLFYIQDINSYKIVKSLDLKENDLFLDACSAPGSKLFNSLDYIKDSNAYSNDVNEKRVELIKNKAKLLGYNDIHYYNFDARELSKHIDIKFNKILLDVPCSGLGVISRKPDIKFHLKDTSLDELQIIQKDILEDVSKLLKKDGLLCYSTCTLNKKENSIQVDNFLKSHNDFIKIKDETIFDIKGDMFYYCVIKRII